MGREQIKSFKSAYYLSKNYTLSEDNKEIFNFVLNDVTLSEKYSQNILEEIALESIDIFDDQQIVIPIYKYSKEYAVLFAETKYKLKNNLITKINSTETWNENEIVTFLKKLFFIYFNKDSGFLAGTERSDNFCIQFARSTLNNDSYTETQHKVYAYCSATLKLKDNECLETIAYLAEVNKETDLMVNKRDSYFIEFIRLLTYYNNLKIDNYELYDELTTSILKDIKAHNSITPDNLLVVADSYSKKYLGTQHTYQRHNSMPLKINGFSNIFALYYGLSYGISKDYFYARIC